MEANMNPNSIIPLYAQIVDRLKRDIENGVFNATGRIPTEAELAAQYQVSRITVRRAVDDLVSQGLVEKKQGKGTFICRQKFAKDIKNLQSFSEMCRHMNMIPGGQMLENKLIPADEKIRKQLNLEEGAYVIYISRLRTADGEPVAIEKNYFPVKYSFLLEKRFDDNSLFECLQAEAKVRVAASEKRIELCRATAAEAKLMKISKGTPLLYIKSVTYTNDREPLYAGVQLFNGETCSFYVCESVDQ
ncbi:MAG: phosphonate metabolism transcriptional regulator PhnF [Clostridium sp.]|nr:phosphonate metabolism transcriptional regulator PhnF [Clostridium sp.]